MCSPRARRQYIGRLSGPLLDRVDIRVRMRPLLAMNAGPDQPEDTATVRARVGNARQRAAERWSAHGWRTNAEVPGPALRRREYRLPHRITEPLDRGLSLGFLTARGADRCIRVAWTLADLADLERPGTDQVAAALSFRDRRAA
jgi:magnesium chelatase family protein